MSSAVLTTPTLAAECLACTLMLVRRGVAVVHCELAADLAPAVGEVATLTLAGDIDGTAETFTGTVRRAGPWQGRTRCVVVLGAGGLLGTLPPRDHVGGPVAIDALLVAQGIAEDAGEALAPDVAANLAGLTLPRWLRSGPDAGGDGGSGVDALNALVDKLALSAALPELTWRTQPDGSLWIGVDAFPDGGDSGNVFLDDDDDGRIDCAPPAATLRPGTTVNGRQIERVTYRIDSSTTRAELLYTVAGDIRSKVATVYAEAHEGGVVAQRVDGSLDVLVDDPRIASLRYVPFRVGIPGCKVTIPAGSRVRLAFADADPSQPFAFALDQDAAAAVAFALLGDTVTCGSISAVGSAPGAPIQFVYTSSAGVPGAPSPVAVVEGFIKGPGHKYAKGVPG